MQNRVNATGPRIRKDLGERIDKRIEAIHENTEGLAVLKERVSNLEERVARDIGHLEGRIDDGANLLKERIDENVNRLEDKIDGLSGINKTGY